MSSSTTTTAASPSARRKPGPKPKPARSSLIVKLPLKPSLLSTLASSPLATVSPTPDSTSPPADPKRKGIPGPKPGAKRSRVSGVTPGKPGRKKTKLDTTPGAGLSKLGPKSNTGAINDKLRALDRSGAPCRRWLRAALPLKSFTGVVWSVPAWGRPVEPAAAGEGAGGEKVQEHGKTGEVQGETLVNGTAAKAEAVLVDAGPAKGEVKTGMAALPQGITA